MMSLTGIRVNVFNENFLNETEQDANSVLTELDKGLRSPKIGVQCEAIVRFPRLFEKYPFPILINSSFLKLAEFFWNGSNLLRFWVLKVCQQSESHLDKILNTEAFVKRIFMVTHSNDPIARAITLRTLGAVSRVIAEKQQIHHCIRRALDSHDTVEVDAAVYASTQFAAQSKTFAVSVCSKIASMIELFQTPISMKLQLIPILRYMHHDANTAAMVKDLCLMLLPKYPAKNFVIAILESLTKLSSKTLIEIPAQIKLLLVYLHDPRKDVRYIALQSLIKLAKAQSTQCWSQGAVTELLYRAETCIETNERTLLLTLFLVLAECPFSCNALFYGELERVIKLCEVCVNLENHTAASLALAILSAIVLNCYSTMAKARTIMELINIHFESLLFSTLSNTKLTKELKMYLVSGVKLSHVDKNFGTDFIEMIGDFITDKIGYPINHSKLLCLTLAALSSDYQIKKFSSESCEIKKCEEQGPNNNNNINPIEKRIPQILQRLNTILESDNIGTSEIIEILCAITFQNLLGCFVPKIVIESINRTTLVTNCWSQYRIGRSALRYGQHFVGAKIFYQIARRTSMDRFHFLLLGISQMAEAECTLTTGLDFVEITKNYSQYCHTSDYIPLIQRLEIVTNLYWKALASFRAGSSSTNPLSFQLEFLKVRCQFIQALQGIVLAKNSQTIVPPPAIAASLAQNSRDYLQKFGHITHQLRKITKLVKACEQSYFKLYNKAFDADPVTLEYLEIAKYQCALLGYILETVCYISPSEPPSSIIEGRHPETKYFKTVCEKIVTISKSFYAEPPNMKTISNRHMDLLIKVIELITRSPLCVPRYFFQILQATQIKLSISPQPRASGEPIIVQSGSNLVIKVEGVIQHFGKYTSLYRTIKYVQLILTSQLTIPRLSSDYSKATNDAMLSQTVRPQRNFLSGCFLLPISVGGQWQVTLETFVIDESGNTWYTGVKNSMAVRVLDDSLKTAPPVFPSAQSRRF